MQSQAPGDQAGSGSVAANAPQACGALDGNQGAAKVRLGDKEFVLKPNESTYIPLETLHRLENPGSEDVHLIEVQTGEYFGEDDIVRYEDIYGRIK